jgi:anaerobic magnesium-protoporphyrin IX monomethyl ester cyclase
MKAGAQRQGAAMAETIRHDTSTGSIKSLSPRNTSRPVMLIGFQEQANLGLGYLASTLRREGYRVAVFDFEQERERILAAAKSLNPVLIGFSLIFQFYVDRFGALIRYLRDNGVTCHFTMGGHFPAINTRSS